MNAPLAVPYCDHAVTVHLKQFHSGFADSFIVVCYKNRS